MINVNVICGFKSNLSEQVKCFADDTTDKNEDYYYFDVILRCGLIFVGCAQDRAIHCFPPSGLPLHCLR